MRFLVAATFTVVSALTLTPAVLAQAPAPKVTITGLFDQVTSAGKNAYDGNFSRDNEREWYARRGFALTSSSPSVGPRPCSASRST